MINNIKNKIISYLNNIDNIWNTDPKKFILLLIFIALLLRLLCFIGFGLGDDPYFASTGSFISTTYKWPSLEFGPNNRYGLFFPLAIFFILFGVNDISFILYPLFTSLCLILIIYMIGKYLFNKDTGLIAACLMAFSTFDTSFSTTWTIDIPTTFFITMSFLTYLLGLNIQNKIKSNYNLLLGAIFLFLAFICKIQSLYIVPLFIIMALIEYRLWKKHLIFYIFVIIIFSLLFLFNYIIARNFLYNIDRELIWAPKFVPPSFLSASYPLWMFKNTYNGIKLFGYYFHFTIFSILLCLFKFKKHILYVLIWFLSFFFIMCYMPVSLQQPFMFLPRFFRYTYAFLPPAILLSSVALKIIKDKNRAMFYFILGLLISSSLYYSFKLSNLYSSHYYDRKVAAIFLDKLPPLPIYSDNSILDTFNFYSKYKKMNLCMFNPGKILFQRDIIEKKDYKFLNTIKNSYIVVGGSRGPDMGMFAVFNLNKYPVPSNWILLKEIRGKIDEYRYEPLRIYLVK